MGYGSRALELLLEYYNGAVPCLKDDTDFNIDAKAKHVEVTSCLDNRPLALFCRCRKWENNEYLQNSEALVLLEEVIEPRVDLPPLLHRLSERRAEKLDYIGIIFAS